MKDYLQRVLVTPDGVDPELKCTPYGDWSPLGPPILPTFSFPIRSQELFREMKSKDASGPITKFKSFEHYRKEMSGIEQLSLVPHLVDTYIPSYPNAWDRYHEIDHHDPFYGWWLQESGPNLYAPEQGLPKFSDDTLEKTVFVPFPASVDTLVQRALASMMPKIKSDLSLINSVLELKDFVSLKHFAKSAESFLLDLAFLGLKTRKKETASALVRMSSSGFLQYKFNIAPLVSDIVGIIRSMSAVDKQLSALINRAGRLRVSHFGLHLNEYVPYSEASHTFVLGPSESYYPPMKGNRSSRQVYTEPSYFHAEMKFNYNFTSYQLEHARLLSFLDFFGVKANPSIIWNAIPWSFAVDWVLSIGRWLNQFEVSNMEPKINIVDFLWSIKRSRRITAAAVRSSWDSNPLHRPLGVSMPTVTETSYKRVAGLPTYNALLASGLNSKEFTLGAALVLSRQRRHKKKHS